MDICPKRTDVSLEHPATQQLLEENALRDQQVRSSSLNPEDQHVHDDKNKLCPLQKPTEATVEDNRCDNNASVFEPIREDVENKPRCGERCESSQKPEKPVSGCGHETKTEPQKNRGVRSDFCNPVMPQQLSLNSEIKEEVSDSGSHNDMKLLSCFFCGSEFVTGGLLTRHISGHTGEKMLTCVICKNAFTSESELVSHLCSSEFQHHQSQSDEQINDKNLLGCSQCGEGFSNSEDLSLHLRIHTRGNMFSCSVCNSSCSDKDSLIQHMRIHTRQTQFTCHVCGKDFAWRRHLTKHMEVHKKRKKVFRCRPCGAEFCTYYLLSKHKVVHQPSDNSHSQTEGNKEEHEQMETSADGEDFEGAELTMNPNGADIQENNVEASVSFKAEDSDFWKETRSVRENDIPQGESKADLQLFASEEDLSQCALFNKEEVELEESKPPQIKEEEEEAEITKFTFSPVAVKTEETEEKPQSLQLHCQSEKSKDFLGGPDPEENEKTSMFSDPDTDDSDCWKPKRKHHSGSNSESDSGRNPSSCSDNKATESLKPESDDSADSDFFKDYKKPQSNLNSSKQEATEKGVKYVTYLKPYSCSQCSKVFRYSSYLKIHMKQHTERYFCSVCGHKSTSSSNLKVHMRTHTGEKPFSCSVCGKKYTNKASMQSHMSVHDAERKYSCDECKKSFAWYTELKYHQCVGETSHEQTYEEDANINLKRHVLYS